MEMLTQHVDKCPSLRKEFFTIPLLESDSHLKKWNASLMEFTKQLRIVGILLAMAIQISHSTDDLFTVEDKEGVESAEAVLNLAMGLPTFAFFGIHFGTQYPPNVQKILRYIMLASASYASAREKGKDDNWILRGTKSLAYGAYYNFFPSEAAEKFVTSRHQLSVSEIKDFWSLTENPVSERAVILTSSLSIDYKLILLPRKFHVQGLHGRRVEIVSPSCRFEEGEAMVSLPVSIRFLSFSPLDVSLVEECKEFRVQFESENAKVQKRRHLEEKITSLQEKTKELFRFGSSDSPPSPRAQTSATLTATLSSTGPPTLTAPPDPTALPNLTTPPDPTAPPPLSEPPPRRLSHSQNLPRPDRKLSDTLIIHIHGGGFVAQTAASHLIHLCEWAKDTEAPIFSIDYRLAPEFPFPTAFLECYYAYIWAVANARKLGTTARRVVLIGDSAGGNLAAAVILKAISDRTRIPDGVVLIYPAVYMEFVPSPSRLLSVVDPMLPTSFLRECFKAYLPKEGETNSQTNPFLSPACAPPELLQQFPPSFIMCGALDPLLDDSIYFSKLLCKHTQNCTLKIYDDFPHGFLNLGAVPGLGREMWIGVKQCSEWLNNILYS